MRIIAGDYKGRKLETPRDNEIRPTTDKVKEAMFSILIPYIEDAYCCDLFAGTGSLGLEALSRGARFCQFSDKERDSVSIIKTNIEKCNAREYSRLIHGDYMKALKKLEEKVDIFFVDPPYNDNLYIKCLTAIDTLDLLNDEGIIIVEHEKKEVLPDLIGSLLKTKERTYGRTILSIYIKNESVE